MVESNLKLPSDMNTVSADKLWKHIKIIAITGNTFTSENLIENGLYTKNENAISRNLAYLKYLNVIDEKRVTSSEGKPEQRFEVKDVKEVKDMMYFIKDKNETEALSNYKKVVENSELFKFFKEEFIAKSKSTNNDLVFLLKDTFNRDPSYNKMGSKFILELLLFLNLIKIDDKGDILLNLDNADSGESDGIVDVDSVEIVSRKDNQQKTFTESTVAYIVRISSIDGEDIKINIENIDDADDVIHMINRIKRKLNKSDE